MPIPVSDKELEAKFGLLAAMLGGNEQMRHGMQGRQFEDALAMMAREINVPVAALKEALAKLPADELAAHAKLMLEQTQQSAHALEEADVYTDALEDADSDDELPALVRSHFRFCPFPPLTLRHFFAPKMGVSATALLEPLRAHSVGGSPFFLL